MLIRLLTALMILTAPAAWACPVAANAERTDQLDRLLTALKGSDTKAEGDRIADQVWILWFAAPDARAQGLLDTGTQRLRRGAYGEAEAILGDLIAYCPAYAEGWNQRAFARFLKGDLEASLSDIEEVLSREPRHFGALAGRVRILIRQGRIDAAQGALRAALAIHPWLGEQGLLPQGEKI